MSRPALRLAAAALWLLAVGCGSQNPAPVSSPTPDPYVDQRGGILRVGMDLRGYEEFQVSEDGTSFNTVWDPQTTWAAEPSRSFAAACCAP